MIFDFQLPIADLLGKRCVIRVAEREGGRMELIIEGKALNEKRVALLLREATAILAILTAFRESAKAKRGR